MEWSISDLLDDLREVDIDIQPDTRASEKRIKELTMKKIHAEKKQSRRGLSTFSKILVVAAVIAALAIPVAAAGRFHFADWLDGLFVRGEDYSSCLSLGSNSKNWQIFGYVLDVKAENASAEGLTLICEEWGNQEKGNGDKLGTLTAEEGFWLENWDGSNYVSMKPKKEPSPGTKETIAPLQTFTWEITWTDSYGTLAPGSYRIGKTFTYTDPAGNVQSRDFYAKFRVFAEDMAPYVESCKAAVEELRTRESYHLTETVYPQGGECQIDAGVYQYYTSTVWKNGDDFLEEMRYVTKDGKVIDHKGYLFRDGKGYKLTWNGDNVLSGVASWEAAGWLNEGNRDLWTAFFEVHDMTVGEVFCEGNTVQILTGHPDEDMAYREITYTMDAEGRLISAQTHMLDAISEPLEDHIIDDEAYSIEVHNTSDSKIAKVIAAQNVDKPVSFSWTEEQAKYPAGSAGVKTEGFVGTSAQTVNMGNVVSIARKECTLEWQNTAVVFYDEAAKVWKVELGFSQDDTVCQTVYLSSEGITLLIVTK